MAPLAFGGGTTASFTLINVPDSVSTLSAKTAWNLRSKVSLGGGTDNQWTATLTGADKLLGGDLNASNSVNILDYSKLKSSWGGGAVGDIDGSGATNIVDYALMQGNWLKSGDPQ